MTGGFWEVWRSSAGLVPCAVTLGGEEFLPPGTERDLSAFRLLILSQDYTGNFLF